MLKRILVNTSSNMAQLIVSMVVTFIMAPIYLKLMGHYDYGLREMIGSLVGYMGMFSLGMQPTVSRFASMHNAQKDRDALLTVYACGLVFLGMVGLLLASFFWVWAMVYPEWLSPDDSATDTNMKYMLYLLFVGASLFFAFPKLVAESYLEGLQRYYFKNMVNITTTIVVAVICYHYMTPENALPLLVGLGALSQVVKLLIFGGVLLKPALGTLYPSLRYFSRAKLKEMLSFGLKSFIQGAAQKVERLSDKLVIGSILGPAALPVYTISSTLVGYMSSITMTLTHVFMPLFSDLNARNQQTKIRSVFMTVSKLVVGLVLPMGVGICLIGGPFIAIWLEGEFDSSLVDGIVVLLVVYMLVPMLNPFASRYLTAINKHVIFAKVAPPAALANLGLSIWLVLEYGVIGAAMGSVLPVFVVMPIFLKVVAHNLEITMFQYIKKVIFPALIPVTVMGCGLAWWRFEYGFPGYLDIVLSVVVSGVVYCLLYWLMSLGKDERELLMRVMPARLRRKV